MVQGTFKKSKLGEVAENSANTEGEKNKVQERERAIATRFDIAQGSHQAVEQVGKRTLKKVGQKKKDRFNQQQELHPT